VTEAHLNKNMMFEKMQDAGWIFPGDTWDCLSNYDKSFIEHEFSGLKTVSYYEQRLKALGFVNKEKILDAACGMGQWSIAMGNLNKNVIGVDITTTRLLIAQALKQSMKIRNVEFHYASIDKMDNIEDSSCDAIFCYGSFMFAPMDRTLAEFRRVLKHGGRLYLNANSIGWYLHLFIDRGIKQRNLSMMITVLKMSVRTFIRKDSNIIVFRGWLEQIIQKNGYKILAKGLEGDICLDSSIAPPARTYQKEFYGQPGILEYLIEKV